MGFDAEVKRVEMFPSTQGRLAKVAKMLKISEADAVKLAAEVMEHVVEVIYDGGSAITVTNKEEVKKIIIPRLNDVNRR